MGKLFAIVEMDGLANFVKMKLQLLLAKIALIMAATFTMVTVSVTQIIQEHGVVGLSIIMHTVTLTNR